MDDNGGEWVQETVQGNSFWYYYDSNGYMVTGWIKSNGEWYYCYGDGTMACNTMVHGYYVNADGKWTKEEISREIVDGNKNHFWYYIGPSGKAVTGWNKIGENFHYYNSPDGSMTKNNTIDGFDIDAYGNIDGGTGWVNDGNGWYYLYDSGAMTYENTVGGYHLDKTGIMVTGTGWKPVDGLWYYLDHDKVVTGWLFDKGNWYYLYPKSDDKTHIEGSMAENTIINGWKVDSSGKWITDDDNRSFIGTSNNDHVCYIFYQPGIESGDKKHSFYAQAKIEAEKYRNKYPGTEVILVPVTKPYDFKQKWNEMDDQSKVIDAVQIILHGSINDNNDGNGAGFMYFEDKWTKKTDDEYRIATDAAVIPDNQKDEDILISDLDKKKMNELYFSSCNSANPDAENVASEFGKIVDSNKITGWDGGIVYKYNDKEPEKSEEVAGGEGGYSKFEIKSIDGCGSYLVPSETRGQPTWWKYVKKDEFGKPVRKREGKVIVK